MNTQSLISYYLLSLIFAICVAPSIAMKPVSYGKEPVAQKVKGEVDDCGPLIDAIENMKTDDSDDDDYATQVRYAQLALQILPQGLDINAANNCGQTRLHFAVLLFDASDAESVQGTNSFVRRGANIIATNKQGKSPLSMAAINKQSPYLITLLLTTCPSIKPALKQLILIGKRYKLPLPKDVVMHCIAPYVMQNETQRQLTYIQGILPEIYAQVAADKQLSRSKIRQLVDPSKVEQYQRTILSELYASLGMYDRYV